MNIYCGSAKVDITPTESKLLAGYMATRQSKGIHDPIYARIVAIRSQQTFIILVSLDLICIDQNYTVELRKKFQTKRMFQKNVSSFTLRILILVGGLFRKHLPSGEHFLIYGCHTIEYL